MARSADVMNTPAKTPMKKVGISSTQGRTQRDVNDYKMPTGPTSINNRKVGLGGDVFPCGTQGPYSYDCESSGSVGIGGDRPSTGSNRKG